MSEDRKFLINLYHTMVKIRRFEETAHDFRKRDILKGSIHTYIGEEAVAVGVCSQLKKEDYITSTHRGHGHCIAKGARLDRMMAELFGKQTGYCKGKGGSMHIADHATRNLGANGIVGGGIPMATGAALGIKYQKKDWVVVCFFGDGASNQGTFHESLNIAAIWKLPVIYICENNHFAMATQPSRSTNTEDIAVRAQAYNIPGVVVDGNDVFSVMEATREAVKRARKGGGPSLLECKTYRMMGHFHADLLKYRKEEEAERWRKRDPILLLKMYLTERGIMDKELEAKIDNEVAEEMEAALEFAEKSPLPPMEETFTDLFINNQERVVI